MKKKMFAIIIAGLFILTVFGAMSASSSFERRHRIQDFRKEPMYICGTTGSVAAVVFYYHTGETTSEPEMVLLEDATVTCKDLNGDTHIMIYEEVIPGTYAYVVYEVPIGVCEITATYQGYSSKIVTGYVNEGDPTIYKMELEEEPDIHPFIIEIINRFTRSFPMLRNLFGQ
jgi:hypothetical protein